MSDEKDKTVWYVKTEQRVPDEKNMWAMLDSLQSQIIDLHGALNRIGSFTRVQPASSHDYRIWERQAGRETARLRALLASARHFVPNRYVDWHEDVAAEFRGVSAAEASDGQRAGSDPAGGPRRAR